MDIHNLTSLKMKLTFNFAHNICKFNLLMNVLKKMPLKFLESEIFIICYVLKKAS